jgi:hypothetical protein
MLDHRQQIDSMRATPHETSMAILPEDDKDYGPTSCLDTIDLCYSSDEDTDEESDDSSCVIIANDEELETEPSEKTYSPTGVRSSRRVRFSDAPPGVYRYEKPSIDCLNQLYYTCHEIRKMREEFFLEQAELRLKSRNAYKVVWYNGVRTKIVIG